MTDRDGPVEIFTPIAKMSTAITPEGVWRTWEIDSRRIVDRAAERLLTLVNRPRVPREYMGKGKSEPSQVYAADLAQLGIIGEAVVILSERVAALESASREGA